MILTGLTIDKELVLDKIDAAKIQKELSDLVHPAAAQTIAKMCTLDCLDPPRAQELLDQWYSPRSELILVTSWCFLEFSTASCTPTLPCCR